MTPTDRTLPNPGINDTVDEDAEPEEQVKVLEKQNEFNEFMVWGHEAVPAADDAFVKGVEEWIKLAEVVCLLPFLGRRLTRSR